MNMRIRSVGVTVFALLAACSSQDARTITVDSTRVTDPSTTIVATTSPTAPPATGAPTSDVPATDAVTSTSVRDVPSGWRLLDPATITAPAVPPCCASNWMGVPSPALPAAGAPLANGAYHVEMQWPTSAPGQPLQLTLWRYEQCSVLPAHSCQENGGSYFPDEMGIDRSASSPLTVPLDAHVRVVLWGFSGYGADPTISPTVVAEGNGADLAALAVAADAAYDSVLAPRFIAGEDPWAIQRDVAAHPTGGFGPGNDGSDSSLSFTFDGAPPLLYQGAFNLQSSPPSLGHGTDVLYVTTVEMNDGLLTIYVYAGFYS